MSIKSVSILIVEDDPAHAEAVRRSLEYSDTEFTVHLVASLREARIALTEHKPEIVLSDLNLEDGKAFDVLLTPGVEHNIPILVMTSHGDEQIAVQALKSGALDYVVKSPEAFVDIPRIVTRALREWGHIQDRNRAEGEIKALNERLQKMNSELEEKVEQRTAELKQTLERLEASNYELTLLNDQVSEDSERILLLNEELIRSQEKLKTLNSDLEKRVEERTKELLISKEKAEESDRLKSAFLANMSHEIRTPMNGIIGFARIISDPTLSDVERTELAGYLNTSCERLLEIITNIIEISKIEAGQVEITEKDFNLNYFIEETYSFYSVSAAKKGIKLEINKAQSDENAFVHADEQKIHQILKNLLSNSVKFTSSGKIRFGYDILDRTLHFFVEDTGIGISEQALPYIFERFRQEDISTTRQFEGAGLGLSIVQGLIDLLGGSVQVESEKGRGTKFSFTIPLKTAPQIIKREKLMLKMPEKGAVQWQGKTILIAEDDEINFKILQKLFQRETSAKILHARNGEEAIDIFYESPSISIILMDIKMPGLNGYEATKIIKEIRPELPIIAVTAFAMSNDRDKVLEAGCDDYISKPFEPKEILMKMNRLLVQS